MDEKIKQIFVGKKFEKFEKKVFSIPSFLFGGIYFAYRKMLIYAIVVSLFTTIMDTLASKTLDFGLMIIAMLCVRISIGLYFPLWYRKFYNNSVKNILANTPSQSEEDFIKSAQKKGGTSIAFIILFIIINSVFTSFLNQFISFDKEDTSMSNNSSFFSTNDFELPANIDLSNATLLEKADIRGYSGVMGKYTITIGEETYNCTADNPQALAVSKDYEEIYANIYYVENDGEKFIVSYELYNNQTNEKIENITDESSLRETLGYHPEGSYEEILTLIEIDNLAGSGFDGEISYTYYDYIFETEKGRQIEFRYRIYENTEDKTNILVENQKYQVKFNVEEDVFGFDYIITDIEEI